MPPPKNTLCPQISFHLPFVTTDLTNVPISMQHSLLLHQVQTSVFNGKRFLNIEQK